jgi:DNA-binding XRE family transcriptional regulator/transposase
MRLSEMGLEPTTLACLHRGGINTTYCLLGHTYRELIWHSEITPEALYDILRALRRHGMALKPTAKGIERPVSERNLEILRLRVVEGRSLKETGEQVGIGIERVRQVLATYFGLQGKPPAVKTRPHRSKNRSSPPDCEQLGRAIQRLRSAKGLTVDELAATIDIGAEQLARIEDGLRDPTWTTLSRLAIALDTTTALLAYAIEVEEP